METKVFDQWKQKVEATCNWGSPNFEKQSNIKQWSLTRMSDSCFKFMLRRHKAQTEFEDSKKLKTSKSGASECIKIVQGYLDIFGKQRPGTFLMHLPSGDVHGPSGKTWQYNSHHVTTDLVQILTRCSPSFLGDFSLEAILLLSGSSAKTVSTCMSLEVPKKDLN